MINTVKLPTRKGKVYLKVAHGHFATNHSHINYYVDVTDQKTRLSDARAAALELSTHYSTSTIIDTIFCLDGTGLIGAFLAHELTKSGFLSINSHHSIYVVEPENNNNNQLMFRDNLKHAIAGKHVLVLAASVSTGYTIKRSVEAIRYYGGNPVGVCSIYSMLDEACGFPVQSIFDLRDLPDYESYDSLNCPLCKKGQKLDALVNSYGYSAL